MLHTIQQSLIERIAKAEGDHKRGLEDALALIKFVTEGWHLPAETIQDKPHESLRPD